MNSHSSYVILLTMPGYSRMTFKSPCFLKVMCLSRFVYVNIGTHRGWVLPTLLLELQAIMSPTVWVVEIKSSGRAECSLNC